MCVTVTVLLGLHRYVFALCSEGSSPQPYKGLQKIGMTGTGRNNLKLSKFLKDYKLNVRSMPYSCVLPYSCP